MSAFSASCAPRRSRRDRLRAIVELAYVVRLTLILAEPQPVPASRPIYVGTGKKKAASLKSGGVLVASYLCMFLARPAFAESGSVLTPVEIFDAESGRGVRIAPGFLFFPRMEADITYDTNLYDVILPKTEDFIASLRPSLLLKSDFSRHALELRAAADIRRYFKTSAENSEQYEVTAKGQFNLGQGIDVTPKIGYRRGIEQRGTAGDVFATDSPVTYQEKNASLTVVRAGRKLELSAGANLTKRDYSVTRIGGVALDLSSRDVTVWGGHARADWRMSDRTKIFAEGGVNEVDYERAVVPNKNSSGYYVLGGVNLQVTSLVDLEAGAGYIHQSFADPTIKSVSGFNYRLEVNWTPAPRWRLRASAERNIDAGRTDESPAIIRSDFRFSAEHALDDRLLVGAEVDYAEEQFRGTSRTDRRFSVRATAHYRLADPVGVIASIGYRDQDGGALGRSYSGFTGTIGVRVEL